MFLEIYEIGHNVISVNRRQATLCWYGFLHDDVIKWKHFPRYWPFVRGIYRSPVNSPHKGQWRGALMLPLVCVWINGWANNHKASDLRRYRAHSDVTVMGLRTYPLATTILKCRPGRPEIYVFNKATCQIDQWAGSIPDYSASGNSNVDDVMTLKRFLHQWPIQRQPVGFPYKGVSDTKLRCFYGC